MDFTLGYGIQGQRYDSTGAAVGSEFRVDSQGISHQRRPDVSYGIDGSFVVIWDSYFQDGSGSGVEGQRYDSTGVAVGLEFQVNSYTTNPQSSPKVSHGINGSVVVWDSFGQYSPRFDIVGKRFPVLLFADGFETGDTSSWSSTSP